MSPEIKICGICNLGDAQLAIDHGAKYLGFIFVPSSPRYIEPAIVRSIINSLHNQVKVVGIFQNTPYEEIECVIDFAKLDCVQLHGNESPLFCASLSKPVIKSFPISTEADIKHCVDTLDQYRPYCGHFLFDKAKNDTNNNWVDFAISELRLVEDQLGDYFFAGGLNASNVKKVLQNLKPAVLDIASGIEHTPREKSKMFMTEFFDNVKKAESQ